MARGSDLPVLGRRVRERRTNLGMSQEQLAAAAGMSKSNITNIEAGRQRQLSPKSIPKVARGLRLPEDVLRSWSAGVDQAPPVVETGDGAGQPESVQTLEDRLARIERYTTGTLDPVDHVVSLLRLCSDEQRGWVFAAVDQLRAEV